MMKLLLTFVFLITTNLIIAQTMAKSTASNGGIELSNNNYTISFTIGEPIVGFVSKNESIDQGFWAGSLFVEPITAVEELAGIVIYPNPMINELNIQTNNNAVYGITMFAVNGKMALKKKVESTQIQHKIDVSHLAQGVYILKLTIENELEEKLFKVIKR
ncbi:T9SS type A sorting domain-containing protein [Aurantibacter crassamenti]|uniref:T9SS type A sorting domain-containing protein n=1 Tax=Aurantibacter crassamenti TaxID=1837375 RepID=UPI00193A6E00|nr:T9SS type A sorting domain-containing protein [Aurantibacter crassamenti]MBM1105392.1 T9SS type A sorting domain-containing protein [Aurantibacter crassamenti]